MCQWVRQFEDGWMNVYNEDYSCRPFTGNDDHVETFNNKIHEKWQFTISELWTRFPQISLTLLYEIVTVRLHYHTVCARWLPHMLTDEHKKQHMTPILMFLQLNNNEGEKFVDHNVTGDKTWIFYSNTEMKNSPWCGSTVVLQNWENWNKLFMAES